MGKLIKALKNLGSKINGNEPDGKYVSEVIDNVANDFENGNTATKDYVNSLMSGALKRAIVEALPEEDIDTNTIYMVLDSEASSGNVYNEYLYINEAWELIGTTAMETPKLYIHNIRLSKAQITQPSGTIVGTDFNLFVSFTTLSATPITFEKFMTELHFDNYGHHYGNNVAGDITINSVMRAVNSFSSYSTNDRAEIGYIGENAELKYTSVVFDTVGTFIDTVIEL